MNVLNFFKAENLWPYVTGEKDIPRNDGYTDYYRSARDFGRLCAITSLQKATSNPSHRPVDYEFVDIYNGVTKALLANIEIGQIDKSERLHLSMKKLEVLSEYIGPTVTDMQSYKKGLQVVLSGNIENVYVSDMNTVNEEYRKRVIGNFGGCLLNFIKCYNINQVREIVNIGGQYSNNNYNKTK